MDGELLNQIFPLEEFHTGQELPTYHPLLCSLVGKEQPRGSMAWYKHYSRLKDVVGDWLLLMYFPSTLSGWEVGLPDYGDLVIVFSENPL